MPEPGEHAERVMRDNLGPVPLAGETPPAKPSLNVGIRRQAPELLRACTISRQVLAVRANDAKVEHQRVSG